MSRVEDPKAREYYLRNTRDLMLSRSMLTLQIKNQAYEYQALAKKHHNFQDTLPNKLAIQADQALKDIYTFDALGVTQPIVEAEVESKMVEKIKYVMLTLGYGFTFVGNQYRIRQNNKDYYIDLLFYNRRLQSLVAMEIKMGSFKPEYAGKMNFYLNLLDDYVREPHENPSIGIILCSERDHFEVEYTLRDINKPVGVSEFRITKNFLKNYWISCLIQESLRGKSGKN
jgi:predicted nuclease of restriction endonuclease-like (RecB) superfamily